MKLRTLIITMAVLCAVNADPFANFSRACTEPETTPVPVWLIQHSPTEIWIIVHGLRKSTSPGAPANGCACAFRILDPITSIDGIQFEFQNGTEIPPEDWSWVPGSTLADGAWAQDAGGGSWEAFQGCNCDGVPTGTAFGIRFLATVPEGTSLDDIEASLLAAPAVLGTDSTDTFDINSGVGSGTPSNSAHQTFWSVSEVNIGDGIPVGIPTVSEWGLMVMTLLLLSAGALILGRKRRAASVA